MNNWYEKEWFLEWLRLARKDYQEYFSNFNYSHIVKELEQKEIQNKQKDEP